MIAICPNPFRDHELKLSKELDALLRSDGFETWICPVFADEEPEVLPEDLVYHQLKAGTGPFSRWFAHCRG